MATGRLFALDLAANTDTDAYTVTAAKKLSFAVNFCNRNATSVTIRLAMSVTGTPGVAEWIMYEAVIEGYGSLERTGLVLDATKHIVVRSNTANVSAIGYGFEE